MSLSPEFLEAISKKCEELTSSVVVGGVGELIFVVVTLPLVGPGFLGVLWVKLLWTVVVGMTVSPEFMETISKKCE